MKKFLKKRYLGLPIGIIASGFISIAVLAAVLIPLATHTITQQIDPVPYVPAYGSIEQSADIVLNNVIAGQSATETFSGAVIVNLGPDGVGKYLHIALSGDLDAYDGYYDVTLISEAPDNPMGNLSIRAGLDKLDASYQLTVEGTYIFTEKVQYEAGSTTGSAVVTVGIYLSDTE